MRERRLYGDGTNIHEDTRVAATKVFLGTEVRKILKGFWGWRRACNGVIGDELARGCCVGPEHVWSTGGQSRE